MTTLTVEIPEEKAKILVDYIVKMGGRIVVQNVEVINKAIKKQQILKDLEESIEWIKLHQEGKVTATSIGQLLKEL